MKKYKIYFTDKTKRKTNNIGWWNPERIVKIKKRFLLIFWRRYLPYGRRNK